MLRSANGNKIAKLKRSTHKMNRRAKHESRQDQVLAAARLAPPPFAFIVALQKSFWNVL
jgi:hypothetical protein